VAGEAFADPGGWRAVAMTASWALPLTSMTVSALHCAAAAGPVFVGATALVVLFTLTYSASGRIPKTELRHHVASAERSDSAHLISEDYCGRQRLDRLAHRLGRLVARRNLLRPRR